MAEVMQGRIKVGAMIGHDFRFYDWPACAPPNSEYEDEEYQFVAKNPNMVFDVLWDGFRWECRANGYGRRAWEDEVGGFGNGPIFVKDYDDVEVIGEH